jgi:hypothetical protein
MALPTDGGNSLASITAKQNPSLSFEDAAVATAFSAYLTIPLGNWLVDDAAVSMAYGNIGPTDMGLPSKLVSSLSKVIRISLFQSRIADGQTTSRTA